MKKTLLFALLLIPALCACAQGAMKNSGDVVNVFPSPRTIEAVAGQRIEFEVNLDIQKSWHLYAHEDTTFIGVDLVPAEGFPLQKFEAKYPAGHEGEFFGEKTVMIEGKEKIHAAAVVPEGLAPGEHVLEFALTVQACDNKTCLAPADLPVKVKLAVK